MKSENTYQITLIALLFAVIGLLGIFTYRELFPEYKIYQDRYVQLEKIRSEITGNPLPSFSKGVKQVLLPQEGTGPANLDRCTSCHVAMKFNHFSPTVLKHDINGELALDNNGNPIKEKNKDYIWSQIDEQIHKLKGTKEAKQLEKLKHFHVGHSDYDATKVLAMHPLIGKETRAFEFHSIEEYGCTSCHNGNGRGITSHRAHGPTFDKDYHGEAHGPKPIFIEPDDKNDPTFAQVFNSKPDHHMLFQTTPLFEGNIMQAKCMECHQSKKEQLKQSEDSLRKITEKKVSDKSRLKDSLEDEVKALVSLIEMKHNMKKWGLPVTIETLYGQTKAYWLTDEEINLVKNKLKYIEQNTTNYIDPKLKQESKISDIDFKQLIVAIDRDLKNILGDSNLVLELEKLAVTSSIEVDFVQKFLHEKEKGLASNKNGSYFSKLHLINESDTSFKEIISIQDSLEKAKSNKQLLSSISDDVDQMTQDFHHGKKLFFSQGCYACHKIEGISRGGVGPELTEIGNNYPWYIKESIVWPQGNLPTSTMPNFKLDHEEVENLVTFLMAQTGKDKASSPIEKKLAIKEWEAGKKTELEKAISPDSINNLSASMKTFAVEGCASCHKLKGFKSNTGFTIEASNPSFEEIYKERQWFQNLFPEDATGTSIVSTIEKNKGVISKKLKNNVREGSLIEKIEKEHPEILEGFYSNFKFAFRAKNHTFKNENEKEEWAHVVSLVLKQYIQEYGLGRLIAPRLNWAGVYRDSKWINDHFRNPTKHIAKSIMPILPFDNTKFYSLTHMLQTLGKSNTEEDRKEWSLNGFSPEKAYDKHCAICHGEHLQSNGPVSRWIYPIPKNLRNTTFLRNLTKQQAINSIVHGVQGTPMPPWGETTDDQTSPVLSKGEISQLVDWLFNNLPGSNVIKDSKNVLKWQYDAKEVLEDLKKEGEEDQLVQPPSKNNNDSSKSFTSEQEKTIYEILSYKSKHLPYLVSLVPMSYTDTSANKNNNLQVDSLFDVVKKGGKETFYIKKSLYKQAHILEGQKLFVENCSVCHGKEGEGNGERSEVMAGAKPRMLTNLPWIKTRDDLRLLRSIKFGVPGTSMTPWGDITTSLQRIQLVMFIRSLSEEKGNRDKVQSSLYDSFEKNVISIHTIRAPVSKNIENLKSEFDKAKSDRLALYSTIKESNTSPDEVAKSYKKELQWLQKYQKEQEKDALLLELIASINKEKAIYQEMGASFVANHVSDSILEQFISLINLNSDRYSIEGNQLVLKSFTEQSKQYNNLVLGISHEFGEKIDLLEKKKIVVQGKLPSGSKDSELNQVIELIHTYEALKGKILSSMKLTGAQYKKQKDILAALEELL